MSGQFIENGCKAFVCGATAIARYARVKLSSGLLVVAGLEDKDLGIATRRMAPGEHGAVRLRTSEGTDAMIASEAITAGATVFTAADGKVGPTATGAFQVGTALEAATAAGDIIEVVRNRHGDTAAS
jgi:hypothetical protein